MPPRDDRRQDARVPASESRQARRPGRAPGRPRQMRRESGGPAGALLSSSDSDPDLESVDCLRCRGCRRRFTSITSLRLHINHKTLRKTECASQARKNPRILVSTWRRGRRGQATGTVDESEREEDELMASMAAAGNNMDLPVDADMDSHQVKVCTECIQSIHRVCQKCATSLN